jgi:hypothetical protein
MKRFLLLRDNQEKGPFSIEELKDMGLESSDLVWVEGKSIAWDHPFNIEELKDLVGPFSSGNIPVFGLLEVTANPAKSPDEAFPDKTNPETYFPNTAESFHSFHSEKPEQNPKSAVRFKKNLINAKKHTVSSFFLTYGVWIIALMVLVAGTTWVIKTAIDLFNSKGTSANMISPVVAPLKTLPEGVSPQKEEDATIQNAISREIVPVDTSQVSKPVKKKPRLKELKKYLKVESNDYKVGIFGGINNLQLTIFNNSSYELDKVVLQVDYLRPKGESVQTEEYTYFSIPPHGKKTLDIPPSKRGVKVKYKILDAKSREYKVALVQA